MAGTPAASQRAIDASSELRHPGSIPTGLMAVVVVAVVGGVGGVILGAITEYITATRMLPLRHYWGAVLSGVALVLAVTWTMLALWHVGSPKWLAGSVLAGALGFACGLIGGVATAMGVEVKYSFLIVAALPAMTAGLGLAFLFVRTSPRLLPLYIAAGIGWLVIAWIVATALQATPAPNTVALPGSLTLWVGEIIWFLSVPLVLSAPLLATAFLSRDRVASTPAGRLWLAAGTVLLPLAVAGSFGLTVHLIPG